MAGPLERAPSKTDSLGWAERAAGASSGVALVV